MSTKLESHSAPGSPGLYLITVPNFAKSNTLAWNVFVPLLMLWLVETSGKFGANLRRCWQHGCGNFQEPAGVSHFKQLEKKIARMNRFFCISQSNWSLRPMCPLTWWHCSHLVEGWAESFKFLRNELEQEFLQEISINSKYQRHSSSSFNSKLSLFLFWEWIIWVYLIWPSSILDFVALEWAQAVTNQVQLQKLKLLLSLISNHETIWNDSFITVEN